MTKPLVHQSMGELLTRYRNSVVTPASGVAVLLSDWWVIPADVVDFLDSEMPALLAAVENSLTGKSKGVNNRVAQSLKTLAQNSEVPIYRHDISSDFTLRKRWAYTGPSMGPPPNSYYETQIEIALRILEEAGVGNEVSAAEGKDLWEDMVDRGAIEAFNKWQKEGTFESKGWSTLFSDVQARVPVDVDKTGRAEYVLRQKPTLNEYGGSEHEILSAIHTYHSNGGEGGVGLPLIQNATSLTDEQVKKAVRRDGWLSTKGYIKVGEDGSELTYTYAGLRALENVGHIKPRRQIP